jgi:hypothetical protein
MVLNLEYAECHLCRVSQKDLSAFHYVVFRYAECHYVVFRYAECRYSECRSAKLMSHISILSFPESLNFFPVLLKSWVC